MEPNQAGQPKMPGAAPANGPVTPGMPPVVTPGAAGAPSAATAGMTPPVASAAISGAQPVSVTQPSAGTAGAAGATVGAGAAGTDFSMESKDIASMMDEELSKPNVAPTPVAPMTVAKPENNKLMLYGLIGAAVIAVIAIVFAVITMINSGNIEAKYKKQVANLQEQMSQMATQEEEELEDATSYIYVTDWNLKLQKPSDWLSVGKGYTFVNNYPDGAGVLVITENATGASMTISKSATACEEYLANNETGICFTVNGDSFVVTVDENMTEGFKNYFTNAEVYSIISEAAEETESEDEAESEAESEEEE